MKSPFKAMVEDAVAFKMLGAPDKTPAGIYIPETSRERQIGRRGKVVAVGPGKLFTKTGARVPLPVKPGDVVLVGQYCGCRVLVDGEEFWIAKYHTMDGMFAVLEE